MSDFSFFLSEFLSPSRLLMEPRLDSWLLVGVLPALDDLLSFGVFDTPLETTLSTSVRLQACA